MPSYACIVEMVLNDSGVDCLKLSQGDVDWIGASSSCINDLIILLFEDWSWSGL